MLLWNINVNVSSKYNDTPEPLILKFLVSLLYLYVYVEFEPYKSSTLTFPVVLSSSFGVKITSLVITPFSKKTYLFAIKSLRAGSSTTLIVIVLETLGC